jgi:hypothetical protein
MLQTHWFIYMRMMKWLWIQLKDHICDLGWQSSASPLCHAVSKLTPDLQGSPSSLTYLVWLFLFPSEQQFSFRLFNSIFLPHVFSFSKWSTGEVQIYDISLISHTNNHSSNEILCIALSVKMCKYRWLNLKLFGHKFIHVVPSQNSFVYSLLNHFLSY